MTIVRWRARPPERQRIQSYQRMKILFHYRDCWYKLLKHLDCPLSVQLPTQESKQRTPNTLWSGPADLLDPDSQTPAGPVQSQWCLVQQELRLQMRSSDCKNMSVKKCLIPVQPEVIEQFIHLDARIQDSVFNQQLQLWLLRAQNGNRKRQKTGIATPNWKDESKRYFPALLSKDIVSLWTICLGNQQLWFRPWTTSIHKTIEL